MKNDFQTGILRKDKYGYFIQTKDRTYYLDLNMFVLVRNSVNWQELIIFKRGKKLKVKTKFGRLKMGILTKFKFKDERSE